MPRTRLIEKLRIGDIIACKNPINYEGHQLALYLGVIVQERARVWNNDITNPDGLVNIQWINSLKYGLQGIFISDLNKQFYKAELIGITADRRVIFKKKREELKYI